MEWRCGEKCAFWDEHGCELDGEWGFSGSKCVFDLADWERWAEWLPGAIAARRKAERGGE